ncbi:MAG: hypothetical protein AB7P04_10730 [Bacteriovoracia bacterium]
MRLRSEGILFRPVFLWTSILVGSSALAVESSSEGARFGFAAELQASSSLHAWDDSLHRADLSATLNPTYRFSSAYTLGAVAVIVQDLSDSRELRSQKTQIYLTRSEISLSPTLELNVTGSANIPLSRIERDNQQLITTLRIAPRLLFTAPESWGWEVSAFYDLGFARHLHEYSTTLDGKANPRYSLSHRLNAVAPIYKKLAFETNFTFTTAWTYEGAIKNQFNWDQALSLGLSEHFTASVGHTNSGSGLKANGVDSNISLYNPNSSSAFLSLEYIL